MLTDHLRAGCPTYDKVAAEYPSALPTFVTYVMTRSAWQQSMVVNEQCKDACDGPRDDDLLNVWQGSQHVAITLNTAVGETFRFLVAQLYRAGFTEGSRDAWIQTMIRALELEDEAALEEVA